MATDPLGCINKGRRRRGRCSSATRATYRLCVKGGGGGGEGREGKGGGRDVRHDQADQYLNKIARHSARPPASRSSSNSYWANAPPLRPAARPHLAYSLCTCVQLPGVIYGTCVTCPAKLVLNTYFSWTGLCNKIRTILGYCKAAFVKRSRASPVYIDSLD